MPSEVGLSALTSDAFLNQKLNKQIIKPAMNKRTLLFFNFICYSKAQQLQLLSQSIHAQRTKKHTYNSTITTQGMTTAILQVLFKKEETNHFCKKGKTN